MLQDEEPNVDAVCSIANLKLLYPIHLTCSDITRKRSECT